MALGSSLKSAIEAHMNSKDVSARSTALVLIIYALIIEIVVIILMMTLGKMIWNNVITALIPGLRETTAFGIFALYIFIRLMSP